MNLEGLARSAVDVIAGRLAQRGTDAAGRLTDTAVDGVYQLIAHRLRGNATGRRVLDMLQRNPADRQSQARVAEMVTDEANCDRQFADSLGRAAAHAGIFVQGQGATYQRNIYDSSGDLRDITVTGSRNKFTNKKYHIGSIRFGTGGLVTGVLGLIVLAGGGTAAVVAATGESADLASAVGEWTQQPGQQATPGWTVGPIKLTILGDGNFTFSMRAKMNVPNDVGASAPAGFGDLNLDCGGSVSPDGDHFTLRTTSGPCGTFEAKLGPDNKVIDVFIDNGSTVGSLALSKVS